MNEEKVDMALLDFTAQIVSAHVSHNAVQSEAVPALIRAVFSTLTTVGIETATLAKPEPAVPVKKSVLPDHIVCLEDGKKLKMLKRHLKTAYNMTPEQYRERWGLAADYPMVAPNYAEHRSSLAKKNGLGRKPKRQGGREIQSATRAAPKKTRGRKKVV